MCEKLRIERKTFGAVFVIGAELINQTTTTTTEIADHYAVVNLSRAATTKKKIRLEVDIDRE